MTDWLFDTLVWTAALIALVLVLRRPVTRWFGPQFAYALWALPMLRLLMPPITLPAWLKPEPAANEALTILPAQTSIAPVATQNTASGLPSENGAAATDLVTPITPSSSLATLVEALPLVEIGCAVWLIGAAIFMWHRFSSYFELRSDLLAESREVGREGKVRLIETPGTNAPIAFGVIDPVIAMPEGFMAQPNRTARDLALAHELAHHHGRDLLINIAVQPLFALHWWNPLGRYGWLALRRDQEAACDARVMSNQPIEGRATYANLIASFAAGPNVAPSNTALAAPMACPVLGDKSIIHRLRSLNMTETSTRRRLAGRFMMGAAIIALPLTASITYAESIAPAAPAAPVAPAAPLAPGVNIAPPAPPAPPVPPIAPAAVSASAIVTIDPDTGVTIEQDADTSVYVYETADEDGKTRTKTKTRVRKIELNNKGEKLTKEEREEILAELREDLAEADIDIKNAMKEVEVAFIEMNGAKGEKSRTIVKSECRGDSDEVATVEEKEGEVRKVYLCQTRVMAHALKGLKEARRSIAESADFPSDMRKDVLREIDRQIREWDKAQADG
ncbi:M56 family metallopeptidase [Erythrobacter sp. F6033]|uniref:M56 family metallopeptidase n=1 Tax=Erythrobacter sp. F6033 TaxID=2926401 RepID=UPI001FF6BF8E|nr:M56 family metallopeptidase [Erythrobacter sp. F6033]MCK0128198.1 M56 family metallopeptidase [Erythrobacter sp. F6033]